MRIYMSAHRGAYFLSRDKNKELVCVRGGGYESRTAANFLT